MITRASTKPDLKMNCLHCRCVLFRRLYATTKIESMCTIKYIHEKVWNHFPFKQKKIYVTFVAITVENTWYYFSKIIHILVVIICLGVCLFVCQKGRSVSS